MPVQSIWNDPVIKKAVTASVYVKFIDIGDGVSGEIAGLKAHKWPDGSAGIQITFADDETPILTASQVMLMGALYELKPVVGDSLDITLVDIEKKGGKTLKRFVVKHTAANGEVVTIDQSA